MFLYKFIFKKKILFLLGMLLMSILSSGAILYSINEWGGPFTLKNVSAFFYQFAYILIIYYVGIIISFDYEVKINAITESNFVPGYRYILKKLPIIIFLTILVTLVFYFIPVLYKIVFGSNLIFVNFKVYVINMFFVVIFSIMLVLIYYLLQLLKFSFFSQFVIVLFCFFVIPFSKIAKALNNVLFFNWIYNKIAFFNNDTTFIDVLILIGMNFLILMIILFVRTIKYKILKNM